MDATSISGLEKLIKDAEYENSRLLSQVEEEKQITADFDARIIAQNEAVATLEKTICKLQEEAETLNSQIKQNKEVADSFRKSSYPIESHIELIQRELWDISKKNEEQSNHQKEELESYTAKWQSYQKTWESQKIAKEVLQTRKEADDMDREMREISDRVEEMRMSIEEERKKRDFKKNGKEKMTEMILEMARAKIESLRIQNLIEANKQHEEEISSKRMELQSLVDLAIRKQQKLKQVEERQLQDAMVIKEAAVTTEQSSKTDNTDISKMLDQTMQDSKVAKNDQQRVPDKKTVTEPANSKCNRFAQIAMPSMPRILAPNKSSSGKANVSEHSQSEANTPSIQPFNLSMPVRKSYSLLDEKARSLKIPMMSFNLPRPSANSEGHRANTATQKDEKAPLVSDRCLMKAPTRGSPGSKRNMSPYPKKLGGLQRSPTGRGLSPTAGHSDLEAGSDLAASDTLSEASLPIASLGCLNEVDEVQWSESFCITGSECAPAASEPVKAPNDHDCIDTNGDDLNQNSSLMKREFGSPLNVNINHHEENIRKFAKSPGDGFVLNSRPMFNQVQSDENDGHAENQRSSGFGGFLGSDSFLKSGSIFSFGGPCNEQDQSEKANDGVEDNQPGPFRWSSAAEGEQSAHDSNSNGFSFFSNCSVGQDDQAASEQAFSFGFTSSRNEGSQGGFSLF